MEGEWTFLFFYWFPLALRRANSKEEEKETAILKQDIQGFSYRFKVPCFWMLFHEKEMTQRSIPK